MFEAEEEQGQFENVPLPMRDRILSILGMEFSKKADEIAFEVERLNDSKPAILMDYGKISFEKLERLAPPGFNVVEISGKKLIVNLDILDLRMPWGPNATMRQIKLPLFIDISQGLPAPRLLNPENLPDSSVDAVGNSNLFFMTSDIIDMMKEIRYLIERGERVIEKRPQWNDHWFPATIYGCLLGFPVILWSDSNDGKHCLKKETKVWQIQWIDGESKRAVYSFWVPESLMTSGVKTYLQQWTDRIFDRNLPHQNYYMLQTLQTFGTVML